MKLEPTQTARPLRWNFRTSLSHALQGGACWKSIQCCWCSSLLFGTTGPRILYSNCSCICGLPTAAWSFGQLVKSICFGTSVYTTGSCPPVTSWEPSGRYAAHFDSQIFQDILGSRKSSWLVLVLRLRIVQVLFIRQTVSSMARSVSCVH